MTIITIVTEIPGLSGVQPRRGHLATTDNLSAVTTANYLNAQTLSGQPLNNGDFMDVIYGASIGPGGYVVGGTSVTMLNSQDSSGINTLSEAGDVPSYVLGVTPGTSAAGKAVVLDANGKIDGVLLSSMESAGNYVAALVASVTTVSTTPASGSCAVQFQFKNAAGANIAAITGLQMYASNSSGVPGNPATTCAALTYGSVIEIQDGTLDFIATDTSGRLGITLTAPAGTYHLSFVLPNGNVVTSSAIVCNA